MLSARRRPELERLAKELVGASVITADLAQRRGAERLAEEALGMGPIDLLIANAGVSGGGSLVTKSVDDIEEAFEVNVLALIVLTRLLLPPMLDRRSGHIVLMASLAGQVPRPGASIYHATKFAVRGFGHSLRAELAGSGVGLSMVSPSFVTGAGMYARSNTRSAWEVTPERVAEATLRAIIWDRAEITVAPLAARVGGRVGLAAPASFVRLAVRAGAIPTRSDSGDQAE